MDKVATRSSVGLMKKLVHEATEKRGSGGGTRRATLSHENDEDLDFGIEILKELNENNAKYDQSSGEILAGTLPAILRYYVFVNHDDVVALYGLIARGVFSSSAHALSLLKALVMYQTSLAPGGRAKDDLIRICLAWFRLPHKSSRVFKGHFNHLMRYMSENGVSEDRINECKLAYLHGRYRWKSNARLSALIRSIEEQPLTEKVTVWSITPEVFAQSLTLVHWNWFQNIQPNELNNNSWQKAEKHTLSPNLCKLADHFNLVSYWVASQIVLCASTRGLQDAIKLVVNFIDIAQALCSLSNFNSMAAILAGLNMHTIQRIKALWSVIPPTSLSQMQKLNSRISPQHNYKKYRLILARSRPPILPYIVVYLRDLTFVEDGNPDEIDGMNNAEKISLVGQSMHDLLRYQKIRYKLRHKNSDVVNYILHLPNVLDEDTLYDKSIELQPVGSSQINVATTESNYKEIPPGLWSPQEVGYWLKANDFEEFTPLFKNVSGAMLLGYQIDDLERIGITKLGPKKRMLKEIFNLNELGDSEASSLLDDASYLGDEESSNDPEMPAIKADSVSSNSSSSSTKSPRARSSSTKEKQSSPSPAAPRKKTRKSSKSTEEGPTMLLDDLSTWNRRHFRYWVSLILGDCKGINVPRKLTMEELTSADHNSLTAWGITQLGVRKRLLKHIKLLEEDGVNESLPIATKPIGEWTAEDVQIYLVINGYAEYIKTFKSECVTGAELVVLELEDLQKLGIAKLGVRKRLLKSLKELKT